MSNHRKKINEIPEEYRGFLSTMKATELNAMIYEKNKLDIDIMRSVTKIIGLLFLKELKLEDLILRLESVVKISNNEARKLALDIVGIRILPIKDWLEEDVEKYITDNGGKIEDYINYVEEQKKAIIKEAEEKKRELEEEEKEEKEFNDYLESIKDKNVPMLSEIDIEKEKEETLKIFKSNLLPFLKIHTNPFLIEYNNILILALLEDPEFKKELENQLYDNDEKITTKPLTIDGNHKISSISNWLKDFIKTNGTGIYDNMTIAKYFNISDNAKKLNSEERENLTNLLQMYRNLKFFPQSLEGVPEDRWEIIPTDREAINNGIAEKKTFGPPTTEDERTIAELEEELKQYKEGSLEHEVLEEEIDRKRHLEDLHFMANKFGEGSLERMAIEEEIRKLG